MTIPILPSTTTLLILGYLDKALTVCNNAPDYASPGWEIREAKKLLLFAVVQDVVVETVKTEHV